MNVLAHLFLRRSPTGTLKPQYAEAHYNLGVAYMQFGKKNEAEEVSRALAAINTELAEKLRRLLNP